MTPVHFTLWPFLEDFECESNLIVLVTTPQIVATVEVYTETDRTKWIIGGTVGGLILLALITAGLYKVKHCTYCMCVNF